MGELQKLLLPFGDGPLIRMPVRAAFAAGLKDVAVVTGAEAESLAGALADLPVTLVENPGFRSGQASSVRTAIAWATRRADALAILLGDEPEIDPDVIERAIETWRGFPSSPLRVRYADRPGHPVIIPLRRSWDLAGDSGLRDFLDNAIQLAVATSAPLDVDTEADYREALARLRQ
jgi:molybdenum cofactor cytidylyltransferase